MRMCVSAECVVTLVSMIVRGINGVHVIVAMFRLSHNRRKSFVGAATPTQRQRQQSRY